MSVVYLLSKVCTFFSAAFHLLIHFFKEKYIYNYYLVLISTYVISISCINDGNTVELVYNKGEMTTSLLIGLGLSFICLFSYFYENKIILEVLLNWQISKMNWIIIVEVKLHSLTWSMKLCNFNAELFYLLNKWVITLGGAKKGCSEQKKIIKLILVFRSK